LIREVGDVGDWFALDGTKDGDSSSKLSIHGGGLTIFLVGFQAGSIALVSAWTDYESGEHVISGEPVTALTVCHLTKVGPFEVSPVKLLKDAKFVCRQVEEYLFRLGCFSFHKNCLAALHNLAQVNHQPR
jgi:hypothetical protein